ELTYEDAAHRIRAQYAEDFPGLTEAQVARLVYRGYRRSEETGGYVRDFDPLTNKDIARLKSERPTFWPQFKATGDIPLAVLRGANSDYLTSEIAARMVAEKPSTTLHTIPHTGHPVMMWEPEALSAIDRLLDRADAPK